MSTRYPEFFPPKLFQNIPNDLCDDVPLLDGDAEGAQARHGGGVGRDVVLVEAGGIGAGPVGPGERRPRAEPNGERDRGAGSLHTVYIYFKGTVSRKLTPMLRYINR